MRVVKDNIKGKIIENDKSCIDVSVKIPDTIAFGDTIMFGDPVIIALEGIAIKGYAVGKIPYGDINRLIVRVGITITSKIKGDVVLTFGKYESNKDERKWLKEAKIDIN